MSLTEEIIKRRTFGIISHPDAGKTTLTEKLLLFGGAIQEAGAVKSQKIKKSATSDFMEIERQRGISVSTSVLAFQYNGKKINILDTPGHKDFAEDTYRTLTAVDSVIVVIDVAKGVEEQTEKLVKVCRMREIPIMVFINKLDREGKDAFDLLDELEKKLNFKVTPITLPIGMGFDFKGTYNILKKNLLFFKSNNKHKVSDYIEIKDFDETQLLKAIGTNSFYKLKEEIEIIEEVYPNFSKENYLNCKQHPVFFGSALNNFGVCELLDFFIANAPSPKSKNSSNRIVKPDEKDFTGFIFKIHANMDPKHRNRLAFIKIISGSFIRNKAYLHVRSGKKYKFSSPNTFFAEKKEIINESFAGDIIGVHDSGNFRIGDTFSEGEIINFIGIPNFSPEHFKYIINKDPLKSKQLSKGIDQLMDEGVAQLFILELNGRKIIGTVGALQFEVIQYRLEHEYGAKCTYENINVYKAFWIEENKKNNKDQLREFKKLKAKYIARDKSDKIVYLADSKFSLELAKQNFSDLKFHEKSEF